jgi:hypothetical protein
MPEMDYAARNVDVTFSLPQTALLEDFWIAFEIFEQTGPLQTIRGRYEQNGNVLEVPFSFQEPEYTYDTGFAQDPFVQEAEKKAAESVKPAPAPASTTLGWAAAAGVALVAVSVAFRSRAARRRRTSR